MNPIMEGDRLVGYGVPSADLTQIVTQAANKYLLLQEEGSILTIGDRQKG